MKYIKTFEIINDNYKYNKVVRQIIFDKNNPVWNLFPNENRIINQIPNNRTVIKKVIREKYGLKIFDYEQICNEQEIEKLKKIFTNIEELKNIFSIVKEKTTTGTSAEDVIIDIFTNKNRKVRKSNENEDIKGIDLVIDNIIKVQVKKTRIKVEQLSNNNFKIIISNTVDIKNKDNVDFIILCDLYNKYYYCIKPSQITNIEKNDSDTIVFLDLTGELKKYTF